MWGPVNIKVSLICAPWTDQKGLLPCSPVASCVCPAKQELLCPAFLQGLPGVRPRAGMQPTGFPTDWVEGASQMQQTDVPISCNASEHMFEPFCFFTSGIRGLVYPPSDKSRVPQKLVSALQGHAYSSYRWLQLGALLN